MIIYFKWILFALIAEFAGVGVTTVILSIYWKLLTKNA